MRPGDVPVQTVENAQNTSAAGCRQACLNVVVKASLLLATALV
jgi:hypothetical protein